MPKRFGFALVAALCLSGFSVGAQTFDPDHVSPADRVQGAIDDDVRVTLAGNRHVLARAEYDTGRMAATEPMQRIQLMLRGDDSQQQALETLLAAQQDPLSPLYRHWLTPEEFGSRFGISDNDLRAVVSWLEDKGFQVEPVPAGRRMLVFSGNVGQVESAFHTDMHTYLVNGKLHHANATDPQIPAALAPVIGGFVSLHDFVSQPQHAPAMPAVKPEHSAPDFTSSGTHYLAPGDFATIYDLAPLYAASTNGTGYSIAIAGRSDINLSDVQTFRSQFGLPAKNPQFIVNGTDPGIVSGDQDESTLDVEWAGAVAPDAAVEFVESASTSSSDGVALSSQYIVNENLAPVMSLSYGSCEAANGTSGNQFWNALWQQAAAQGMSVFVAAGDSGAAGCDSASETTAVYGKAINGLCSSPYSTCVGGTEFNDTANPSQYWSSSNTAGTYASALSYIPENVWNESGLASGGSDLWAGGGGASIVYSKPSWQTGTGVPAQNQRYVPDVALAAAGHDGYLVVLDGDLYVFSGTSCAAPSFAALATLVVEREGARLGNMNPTLYTLGAGQATGATHVFHDVTSGNNSVPGLAGFSATTGYDPVTGWGSVDANQLVSAWPGAVKSSPSFQFAPLSPTSLTEGASASLKITLNTSGGFNAAVALTAASLPNGLTASFSPATIPAPGAGATSMSSTLTLAATSQLTAGVYNITISGTSGTISQSAALSVTVTSKCSYTISPTSVQQPSTAGTYSFSVTAPASCSWTVTNNSSSWITIKSGATGTANGQVSYSLSANTGAARTGSLTAAGATFQVVQTAATAANANFTLNPSSANVSANGGNEAVVLEAPSVSSKWTAQSNATWITIPAASASGAGSAYVSYLVAANTSTTPRSGTLTIAGLTFTVTQAAVTCNYSLEAGSETSTGFSLSVITPSGCAWTAVSNTPSWLTIKSGATGNGGGTVTVAVQPNTGTSPRTGSLTVAGWNVEVTEQANAAAHTVRMLSGIR
jgi:pseudomonalisin